MSLQKDQRILVAALACYTELPASADCLLESCRQQGIELTLLGRDRAFENYLQKFELVAEYLSEHPEYEYVLQLDLKDVLVCATLREVMAKYQTFGHAIVMSAERRNWPLPSHANAAPVTGSSYRYGNSGGILATSRAWQQAWSTLQDKRRAANDQPPEIGIGGRHIFNEDQAAWNDLYIRQQADIVLDYQCLIFQTLQAVDGDFGTANPDLLFEGRRIMNRETGARPCILHGNGGIPLELWKDYVLHDQPRWALPLLERIRSAPRARLREPDFLEELLLWLGLHHPVEDAFPDHLLPYAGKGLQIWQFPNQYAPFLQWLSGLPPVRSFVEIGVNEGGSFLTTVEYLRIFHPLSLAVGVDPYQSSLVQAYVKTQPDVRFLEGASSQPEFLELLNAIGLVDLVFVDGDHTEAGVRFDWETVRTRARYVAFHDILDDYWEGVGKLWAQIKTSHRRTWEFVDVYPTTQRKGGIGVVDLAYGEIA